MTGSIDKIQDVTIRARNVTELRTFYKRVGLREVLIRGDDFVVLAAGKSELVIHAAAEQPVAAVGLALLVDDTAAIEKKLRDAKIPFEGPMPLRPGKTGIKLTDPNGNILEFLQPARV